MVSEKTVQYDGDGQVNFRQETTAAQHSLEITRGQRGDYGYSLKLYFSDAEEGVDNAQNVIDNVDAWFQNTYVLPKGGIAAKEPAKRGEE